MENCTPSLFVLGLFALRSCLHVRRLQNVVSPPPPPSIPVRLRFPAGEVGVVVGWWGRRGGRGEDVTFANMFR